MAKNWHSMGKIAQCSFLHLGAPVFTKSVFKCQRSTKRVMTKVSLYSFGIFTVVVRATPCSSMLARLHYTALIEERRAAEQRKTEKSRRAEDALQWSEQLLTHSPKSCAFNQRSGQCHGKHVLVPVMMPIGNNICFCGKVDKR